VQPTWKLNHDKLGRAIGLGNGLLLHLEHALEPSTAYSILPYGMRQGSFTTRKLSDYIHDNICDCLQARTIINALDQAALIQGYAEQLEQYSERKPRHARSFSNGPTSPITSTEGRALALTIATN
jgi:hypothetical protein